ncbi:MAG: hypothetical protein RLZ12_514 [Bacillota bacterium]|jgi:GTP pyrophosphokinase
MLLKNLFSKISSYLSKEDLKKLTSAYLFAKNAHEGQFRKSGEPYIIHPLEVAIILTDIQPDLEMLIAVLLHDVVEDTEISLETISSKFGPTVASLVCGVTKLTRRIKFTSSEERQAENYRKMFVAMAKDIKVVIIKLADRLHNMRTLCYMPEHKQVEKSKETLQIFAPLAHRLGMSKIKWELEDLSFRYIDPPAYYRIVNLMHQKRRDREAYMQKIMQEIEQYLTETKIKYFAIDGRPKHIYSIYCKMKQKDFEEIYDLHAVRIILHSIRDCYAVLGIVHTIWKPVLGRFKDYIAMPKPNMYQSIHTTVFGNNLDPIEFQIRTLDMHKTAEYGIAAHWAYKEQNYGTSKTLQDNMPWVKQLMELQNDSHDAKEFVESLMIDWFSDSVFVFTPKGEIIELPVGSVIIDFAFRIHTEIGYRCIGAKINGKIAALDIPLKTGDIVEVITSRHSYGPSLDWLKLVKTRAARNRIRAAFKKQRKEEVVSKGRETLFELAKQHNITLAALKKVNLTKIAAHFNLSSEEELLIALCYGNISGTQIISKILFTLQPEETPLTTPTKLMANIPSTPLKKTDCGVQVPGIENVLIKLSKCCNPVPGDDINGFITKGRGITVHRTDCTNLLGVDESRKITVVWSGDNKAIYHVDLEICGLERLDVLNDILQVLDSTKARLTAVIARENKAGMSKIHITIGINNIAQLNKVVDQIKNVRDVYSVRRVLH